MYLDTLSTYPMWHAIVFSPKLSKGLFILYYILELKDFDSDLERGTITFCLYICYSTC